MIITGNMFELYPPGTKVGLVHKPPVWASDKAEWVEEFTVCEDGVWRNEFGMIPAGQVNPPPETPRPTKHCRGCRCGEHTGRTGRTPHGGSI